MYVLVVDDEAEIADLLVVLLQSQGIQAGRVCNAKDALQAISLTPVDLVITDLMMPAMDGAELVERLRSISGIPVILMSAISEPRAVASCPPVEGFLQKPFTAARLQEVMRHALRKRVHGHAHDSDRVSA